MPRSLVNVALLNDESEVSWDLPNLRNVEIDVKRHDLPWNQVEEAITCNYMPNKYQMEKLRHIKINQIKNNPISFREANCPRLTLLNLIKDILNESEDFEDDDVVNLFDASQKIQITELCISNYGISNFDHFELLKSVEITMHEPLTNQLMVPQTLETLRVWTTYSVTGIPEQVKFFFLCSKEADVTITSSTLLKAELLDVRNASILCPQLLTLSVEVSGRLELDTPNAGAVISLTDYANNAHVLELPAVSSVTLKYCSIRTLRIGRALNSLKLYGCGIDDISVEAREVWIILSLFDFTNIIADKVGIFGRSSFGRFIRTNIRCRELNASGSPLLNLQLYRGVEDLTVLIPRVDVVLYQEGNILGCRAFMGCSTLQRLKLNGVYIDCSESRPLFIPASVKSVEIVNVGTKELWLKFEDESQLQHMEVVWKESSPHFKKPALHTMRSLGLVQTPPSFYCPNMKS